MGSQIALCGICQQPMAGSAVVDCMDPAQLAAVYVLHLVDEHWDMIEQIRAATSDPQGRDALCGQLAQEWAR